MTANNQPVPPHNSYVLDPESAAEVSRLQTQEKMVTQAMGGLLPELPDLSKYTEVLDLACGPGDWALDLAYANRHMNVVAVDISQRMVSYANARRTSPNVSFRIMNITQPLEFPDASFDLINARYINAVLPKTKWSPLLDECRRLLRPGGLLRLTEPEVSISNSPACERYNGLLMQAMKLSGHSFSPDGKHVGITPMLGGLLSQAGFTNIRYRSFIIDSSFDSPAHHDTYENARLAYLLMQPFIMKMGLATQDELTDLYLQSLHEIKDPDFRSIMFNLVAIGEAPASEA